MPPTPPKLTSAALRKLRSLGHALSPVVALGKDGLTASLVAAADAAIGTHELVKVKIQREAPVDRHEAGIELAARTGSVLVQVIGRTMLLYRRHPKKPKIELPVPGKRPASPKPKAAPPSKTRADDSDDSPVESPGEMDGDSEGDPEENP
jgi:RNA-binding protein